MKLAAAYPENKLFQVRLCPDHLQRPLLLAVLVGRRSLLIKAIPIYVWQVRGNAGTHDLQLGSDTIQALRLLRQPGKYHMIFHEQEGWRDLRTLIRMR